MERFFGGSPVAVLLKLVALSIIVGIVLAAFNLDAFEIFNRLGILARRLYDMGFDAIEWAFRYFLLGAVIVFPIWFVSRLLKSRSDSTGDRS